MKIRTKFILIVTLTAFSVGFLSVLLTNSIVRQALEQEMENRAATLAKTYAALLFDSVLQGEEFPIRRALVNIVDTHDSIKYAYIIDFNGKVFVQNNMPHGLPKINKVARNVELKEAPVVYRYIMHGEQMLEVSYPFVSGPSSRLATKKARIHIGMCTACVHILINKIRNLVILATFLVVVLGIIISFFVSKKLTQHFTSLSKGLRAFGQGKEQSLVDAKGLSFETQELVKSFNAMVNERKDLEDGIKFWKERYEAAISSSGQMLYEWDIMKNTVIFSGSMEKILGYSPSEIEGDFINWRKLIHPKNQERYSAVIRKIIDTRESVSIDYRVRKKDGGYIYVLDVIIFFSGKDGEMERIIGFVKDITHQKTIEQQNHYNFLIQSILGSTLQISLEPISLDQQLGRILELIFTIPSLSTEPKGCIFILDRQENVLKMRAHWRLDAELVKKCKKLPVGKCLCGLAAKTGEIVFTDYIDDRHEIRFTDMLNHGHYCIPIKGHKGVTGVLNLYVKEGHQPTEKEKETLLTLATTLAGLIERKEMEQNLQNLAHYDALTGVPNRMMLFDRLHSAMAQAGRNGTMLSVLFVDLDKFKPVNDNLGHSIGDELLTNVAERLQKVVRQSDMVARIGGDEFAIILTNIAVKKNVALIAKNIIDMLNQPFQIKGHECKIGASIGISMYPENGNFVDELLKNADIAMYHSKKTSGNTYKFYTNSMNQLADVQAKKENDLRAAIENNELKLFYQPVVELDTNNIISVEALVRWEIKGSELVSPKHFIALAENTGLIIPIGKFVLKEACTQMKEWTDGGLLQNASMSVNMSVCQFFRQVNLSSMVTGILDETRLSPERLELEITESICMQNMELTNTLLQQFSLMGINISIDDFGTGYSSISYLKNLPINSIKIDGSFIKQIGHSRGDEAIVEATAKMAHSLGLKVIAEGVETKDEIDALRALEYDAIQGYIALSPKPAEEMTVILREGGGKIHLPL